MNEFVRQMGVQSFICVPIVYEEKSLGVLVVENNRSRNHLVQSDISFLMGVASQTATGIIKSHRGAITVHSKPGKGTAFAIYLPLIRSEVKTTAKTGIALPTGDERILFVDDEKTLVDLGQQVLERLRYSVVCRTSSIEALELFKNRPDQFDLVITDMTMPNLTGEKLARQLMSIRSDIPVILCTGFSEQISEEKAKKMGISEFIFKPLVMDRLAQTVRAALERG